MLLYCTNPSMRDPVHAEYAKSSSHVFPPGAAHPTRRLECIYSHRAPFFPHSHSSGGGARIESLFPLLVFPIFHRSRPSKRSRQRSRSITALSSTTGPPNTENPPAIRPLEFSSSSPHSAPGIPYSHFATQFRRENRRQCLPRLSHLLLAAKARPIPSMPKGCYTMVLTHMFQSVIGHSPPMTCCMSTHRQAFSAPKACIDIEVHVHMYVHSGTYTPTHIIPQSRVPTNLHPLAQLMPRYSAPNSSRKIYALVPSATVGPEP